MKIETLGLACDTFRDFSSYASHPVTRRPDPQDRGLLTNANHALSWLIGVPGVTLIITVEYRWVTLSGQVDWDYQRVIFGAHHGIGRNSDFAEGFQLVVWIMEVEDCIFCIVVKQT